jgi:hypothetical protein
MKPLLPDELWERIEPLLPPPPRRRFRFPGRKPLDYRKILTGIIFVLTAIPGAAVSRALFLIAAARVSVTAAPN